MLLLDPQRGCAWLVVDDWCSEQVVAARLEAVCGIRSDAAQLNIHLDGRSSPCALID